jgi:hypothetical protein
MLTRWIDPVILFSLAGVSIWDGLRINRTQQDTFGATQAGGWVALVGVLLAICTTAYAYRELKTADNARRTIGPNFHLVLIAFAMVAIFVLLLDRVGYLVCTAVFFAVYLRYFGRYGWPAVLLGSVSFAVGSAYLWSEMSLMLPQGVIPWP